MLNLRSDIQVWPDKFRPVGHGTFQPEPLSDWWARIEKDLNNLHPVIAEQWVYRHFDLTNYNCLDLSRLSWVEEMWPAEDIIAKALMPGNDLSPAFDYEVFAKEKTATGHPFLSYGSWDYPVVLLHTPSGVCTWQGEFPQARYLLIEGHQRLRMLNAMFVLGKPLAPMHRIFILYAAEA